MGRESFLEKVRLELGIWLSQSMSLCDEVYEAGPARNRRMVVQPVHTHVWKDGLAITLQLRL